MKYAHTLKRSTNLEWWKGWTRKRGSDSLRLPVGRRSPVGHYCFTIEAATWGLNRISADQRGRSGCSAMVVMLDTGVRQPHQIFTGRASPDLDMTVGDPKECGDDLTCTGDLARRACLVRTRSPSTACTRP